MTSLQPPLTIISDSGSQSFQPPAATWFDEDPLHFVALEARPPSGSHGGGRSVYSNVLDGTDFRASVASGIGTITEAILDDPLVEIVQYQAFGLPKHDHRHGQCNSQEKDVEGQGSNKDDTQSMSAFDAAKQAAQDNLKTLTTDISVFFPLPYALATIEVASPSVVEDDYTYATDSTVAESRRIPILAKFSPKMSGGMRFLAMQYSPSMVRIAMVEGRNVSGEGSTERKGKKPGLPGGTEIEEGDHSSNIHWTIDLSYHADPIASKPEELPDFESGSNRNLFGKQKGKGEEGIIPGETSIIGGGVLWSARENQYGFKSSLDLVLVTTTSVIVYTVNVSFKQCKLVKTQVLSHDLAASFWYESITRTLVVGSYKPNASNGAGHRLSLGSVNDLDQSDKSTTSFPSAVMAMKTLFFSKTSSSVEMLPSFAVGTLREVELHGMEDESHELDLSLESYESPKMSAREKADLQKRATVLPTELFLVNLYGSVYCVELGSLGMGKGLGLTKLDREAGCIHVRHHNFDALVGYIPDLDGMVSVGVIDNLLCIFSKSAETTYFIDVADIFSDDQRVIRECIQRLEPETHNENFAFLAPNYFLDTSGQGLLYQVVLSLPLLLQCVPPSASIIPFILRRNGPKDAIRAHIMGRFSKLIETRDMPSLRLWIGVLLDQYSKSDVALKFDFESTVTLLSKCSLVSVDDLEDADDPTIVSHIMVPSSCGTILTQTEILQMILLPHAMPSINNGNPRKLRFISSLSVHYFVELERRLLAPSAALQCLVVALLWRTGENAELKSFLSAQQSQWAVTRRRRQMELPTANRMYYDKPGAIPYAQTLFTIASQKVDNKAPDPSTARQLTSYATIILLGSGATFLAVKCLLSAGHLNDAINICTKKIRPGPNKPSLEDSKFGEGTRAKDFFRAAVANAKNQSSIADRCKSFYHLDCFLRQWEPIVFTLDSRKIKVARRRASIDHMRKTTFRAVEEFDTVAVEQSVFAHECPRFPDELFGGKESVCCRKLRAMFGYAENISTNTKRSDKFSRAKSCPNVYD